MEQTYTPKQDYKVLVRCITYNQAKYIEDALNGFAMQITDFPFVCLVVDDCSTDGEIDVIKAWMSRECDMARAEQEEIEYSNIILVPHKSNPTCSFAFYFLKHNLYKEPEKKHALYKPWREHCEYEAMCEGDDYWIADDKLQLQVNIMKIDPNTTLSCARAKGVNSQNQTISDVFGAEVKSFEDLLVHNCIPTVTTIYRCKDLFDYTIEVPKEKRQTWKLGDYPLWLWLAKKGKIHFMDKITSAYRMLNESASRSNNYRKNVEFDESVRDVQLYFAKRYNCDKNIIDVINARHDIFVSAKLIKNKQYKTAYKYVMRLPLYHKFLSCLRLIKSLF